VQEQTCNKKMKKAENRRMERRRGKMMTMMVWLGWFGADFGMI
jgi:hypothetical protein